MNDAFRAGPGCGDDGAMQRAKLARQLRAAARSQIHGASGGGAGWTAIYTLADPRDVRCARYVGQTRDPRRRFAQHVHTARLWWADSRMGAGRDARGRATQEQLPKAVAETPWWVPSPRHRPLYAWIRALHADGGRLPFMWVAEWVEPDADRLAAERGAIVRLLAQGAELLNAEARLLGAQLPLL